MGGGQGVSWSASVIHSGAMLGGGGGGGCSAIYFLYRDVPPVRVSFSGSSVLNRVYNFTFSCFPKQGRHRKSCLR